MPDDPNVKDPGGATPTATDPTPPSGESIDNFLDVPVGRSEGALKTVKTIGDLATAYEAAVKEITAVKKELKSALAGRSEKPTESQGTKLWNDAIASFEEHGRISGDLLTQLEKSTGIPGSIFSRVATSLKEADARFSQETQRVLGVDSERFQQLMEEGGYSDAYREFAQDQIIAGRFAFLADLAADLQSRGLIEAPKANGDGSPAPGQQPAPRQQVEQGQPASPPRLTAWESESAFQAEHVAAYKAERAGDPSKLEAITTKLHQLEKAGIPFYPGASGPMRVGDYGQTTVLSE